MASTDPSTMTKCERLVPISSQDPVWVTFEEDEEDEEDEDEEDDKV